MRDKRVDILTYNQAVIKVYENQGGGGCHALKNIMKEIFFNFVSSHNIDLHLYYVPSKLNEADAPSRQLSLADSTLARQAWLLVESTFGPHTLDRMALDSNTMCSVDGCPLRHFTVGPSPHTAGINIFSQDITCEGNPYVFPPISMIFPVISLLKEQGTKYFSLVAPALDTVPIWWLLLQALSVGYVLFGKKGQKKVLKIPGKIGYVLGERGLRWDLVAYRLSFVK